MVNIIWETAGDWDSAASDDGVVHESVANTDHDDGGTVKRGYSAETPLFGTDLAIYWPLQEDSGSTANDFSGAGNDGTVNGATLGASGLLGTSAYGFDGTDDYVEIADDPSFSGLGSFTISLWFTHQNAGSRSKIAAKGVDVGSNRNYEWEFSKLSDETIRFDVTDGTDNTEVVTSTSTAEGVWYHVGAVYDDAAGDIEIYLDGSLEDSATPVTMQNDGGPLWLGAEADGGSGTEWLDGRIAEFRFYDAVLSGTQLQTIIDVVETNGTLTTDWRSP